MTQNEIEITNATKNLCNVYDEYVQSSNKMTMAATRYLKAILNEADDNILEFDDSEDLYINSDTEYYGRLVHVNDIHLEGDTGDIMVATEVGSVISLSDLENEDIIKIAIYVEENIL